MLTDSGHFFSFPICEYMERKAVTLGHFQGTGIKMQGIGRLFVFLLMLSVLFHAASAVASSWTAEVIRVNDGDSITVKHDKRIVKVRLYGIDSPEIEQPYGRTSRSIVRQWLVGKRVKVEPMYRDSYGRTVAQVWAGDALVNAELVKNGAAWVYPRFCRERDICEPMARMQQNAQQARLGLWQNEKPEPPWQWKRKQRQQSRR